MTGRAMKRIELALIAALLFGLATPRSDAEEGAPPPSEGGEEDGGDTTEFDAIVAQAVAHYQAQRYDQAVETFQRAYAIRSQPELIYNIARVYERAVRPRAALEQYERFLSLPNTTSDLRGRAATSVASLRTEIAAMERAARPPTAPEGTNDGSSEGSTTTPEQPVEEGPSNGGAIAGWVLVGLGAATLAAGVVLGGLALSEQTATEEANSFAEEQTHFDRGTSFALAADVLFGAGGALAVAGMIVLIVRAVRGRGADAEEETPYDEAASAFTFSPSFTADGGLGLSLGGRF